MKNAATCGHAWGGRPQAQQAWVRVRVGSRWVGYGQATHEQQQSEIHKLALRWMQAMTGLALSSLYMVIGFCTIRTALNWSLSVAGPVPRFPAARSWQQQQQRQQRALLPPTMRISSMPIVRQDEPVPAMAYSSGVCGRRVGAPAVVQLHAGTGSSAAESIDAIKMAWKRVGRG